MSAPPIPQGDPDEQRGSFLIVDTESEGEEQQDEGVEAVDHSSSQAEYSAGVVDTTEGEETDVTGLYEYSETAYSDEENAAGEEEAAAAPSASAAAGGGGGGGGVVVAAEPEKEPVVVEEAAPNGSVGSRRVSQDAPEVHDEPQVRDTEDGGSEEERQLYPTVMFANVQVVEPVAVAVEPELADSTLEGEERSLEANGVKQKNTTPSTSQTHLSASTSFISSSVGSNLGADEENGSFLFFSFMADYPWLFAALLPAIFALLVGLGWSDKVIEDQIDKLWIPESGSYYRDQNYAFSLGVDAGATLLPGMAVSRDGGNIMTADRLEAIRTRMEETENTVVNYKGIDFTWPDICSEVLEPYEFPCLRLSPMDLYKEARFYFSPDDRSYYYKELIQKVLIAPRLPRFGIIQTVCRQECSFVLGYRTDPASVGYPNAEPSPLKLLADIGDLEFNDPCKICIEDKYEKTIQDLHAMIEPAFSTLHKHVVKASTAASPGDDRDKLNDIAAKLVELQETVTTQDVAEFFSYYVLRTLYGELGVDGYLERYAEFGEYLDQCPGLGSIIGLTCPLPLDQVDNATATQHLLDHADNAFSSVVTSGAPYPFWSRADGTGELLRGNAETGRLYPVSGSGVNMSAPMESLSSYFAFLYLQPNELADPDSREWKDTVETNPLYAWFMAGVTPAEEGTMCANGNLTGTKTGIPTLDDPSNTLLGEGTPRWCTEYNVPNVNDTGAKDTVYTKQYFARMWYDLLIASESLLDFVEGQDDPYSWTLGAGCDYELGEERFSYTNQSDEVILYNSSRVLYNIDEGTLLGAVDRNMLIGGARPAVSDYSYQKPLEEVVVLQNLYVAALPDAIVQRVKNCNRPGGPVDLTWEEARELLEKWKEAMENSWNRGWDDEDDGEIQFVSYFGEAGDALGSTGRMLQSITLDNNKLTTIAVIAIGVFSILFLFSFDPIDSRVLLMIIGFGLVVFSFYAGIGFGMIIGMKLNVAVAWTLPFVILGLGVDDVYIVLLAIKKQRGYSKKHWLKAMKEVAVPVTMTSLVNASILIIMNLSDIPVIYLTTRFACFCIIALYLSVLFCFPAFCLLDLRRQEAGRMDVLVCLKSANPPANGNKKDFRQETLYDHFYKPIILGRSREVRGAVHFVVFLISFALLAVGAWGVTERSIGIGLEEFFPSSNPAGQWASLRTQYLSSWSVSINWGAIDYTDTRTQLRMMKQFEDVVATPAITEVNTNQLWIADFAIWTSRHCDNNFDREDFDEKKCGRDQLYEEDNSTCAGSWVPNALSLREKNFQDITDDTCAEYEGGVCRPRDRMHADDMMELDKTDSNAASFCPVIEDWSNGKWKFCLERWRNVTGASHTFILEDEQGSETDCGGVYNQDESITWPLPYSRGPNMFAVNMFSHQDTVDVILETRAICDDDEEIHCWMSGVPYDYWAQYDGIFNVLMELSAYAVFVGIGISFVFLFGKLVYEKNHTMNRILVGSLIGAVLIGVVIVMSLVTVTGLSCLAGVNLTGFSNLAFILSVGFSVEYSVHIVSRWMRANMSHTESLDRVDYTMSFLMLPTFMSFVSSTIGVVCLAFTEFDFNTVYFFRPLMIVMVMSYWYGCWFLPTLLVYLDFDAVKLGKPVGRTSARTVQKDSSEAPISGEGENTSSQKIPTTQDTFTPPVEEASYDLESSILASREMHPSRPQRPDPPTSPTMLIKLEEVQTS